MAPPSIDELTLRLDRETDLRERGLKYAHNMMEDLKEVVGEFRINFARFGGRFDQHIEDDKEMGAVIAEMKDDIRVLTRALYMASGGLVAVGGIATFFGWNILKLLGH